MIDLDDERTGKIAEVISNKTSKRILISLAEEERSETEIANILKIPLNTVHYNVKKLEDAGLIEKIKGFLWSVKGKRIHKYKIVDKRIIISPKSLTRGIVPAVLISGILALGIKIFVGVEQGVRAIGQDAKVVAESAGEIAVSSGVSDYSGTGLYEALANAPNSWAWFLIGALTALLIFVLWNWRGK